MSLKSAVSIFLVVTALYAAGCASRPRANVAALSTDPVTVDDGSRKVNVSCTREDTVIKLGDAVFTIKGSRGYIGQIESQRGWVEVGKVSFRYDGREVSIRGTKAWQNLILDNDESRNFVVDQEGKTMRSIYKSGAPESAPAPK